MVRFFIPLTCVTFALMPIYMDVHIVPGVKAKDVAEAHRQDLLHQGEYECKCMTYWIDESRESIFCLIEAPNKEAVSEMHRKAHGLVPNKIIEVNSNLVESFLGRIYDPEHAITTADGLKIFADPSYRVLLVIQSKDPVLLHHELGNENANELLQSFHELARKNILLLQGAVAEHREGGYVVSFAQAGTALQCASNIQKDAADRIATLSLRMALHGGEPIENSPSLFGDTIEFAEWLNQVPGETVMASAIIKEMLMREKGTGARVTSLSVPDEELLRNLYTTLHENWQEPGFDVEGYSQNVAMSQSQLYRKSISLTGHSPNQLLREYRLEKARQLLRKQQHSISQVTFETGFSSPSYFTKCFKKKFGMLPQQYLDAIKQR